MNQHEFHFEDRPPGGLCPPTMGTVPAGGDGLGVREAANPILEAAKPLLRTLAEIHSIAELDDPNEFQELLVADIRRFQNLCDRAGLRRDQMVTVTYCLCTALDEAINQRPWARRDDPERPNLLVRFFDKSDGGEKFFTILATLCQDSAEHLKVIEIMYYLLSLGFKGRFVYAPDGERQLADISRHLWTILSASDLYSAARVELSRPLKVPAQKARRFFLGLPVWISVSVMAVILLVLFMSLTGRLNPAARNLEEKISALEARPDPALFTAERRPAFPPLIEWFSPEYREANHLAVFEAENRLAIFGNIFKSGGILPVDALGPTLDTIAARLLENGWSVQIVGHTDNTPVRVGSIFRDNFDLSAKRAESIRDALIRRGVPAERLSVDGRGTEEPADPRQNTPEGRSRNRRVEMIFSPADEGSPRLLFSGAR